MPMTELIWNDGGGVRWGGGAATSEGLTDELLLEESFPCAARRISRSWALNQTSESRTTMKQNNSSRVQHQVDTKGEGGGCIYT